MVGLSGYCTSSNQDPLIFLQHHHTFTNIYRENIKKIPVRITSSSNHIHSNIRYKNRRHNEANCIKVNISPSPASISSSAPAPSLLVTNACHITNKVVELSGVAAINKPSIALITESWLDPNTPDSGVSIGNRYNIYRRDRLTPGGGVLAYVDVDIPVTRLNHLEEDGREVLWLMLKYYRSPRPFSSILIIGVYYPPGQNAEDEKGMLEYLTNGLDCILSDRPSTAIVITGDFNQMKLEKLSRRFNLRKLIKAPTRGRNTLDQILTNMHELYDDAQHLPPLGRSDHQCLLLYPKQRPKIKSITREIRQTKPGNMFLLKREINLEEWDTVFAAKDVDTKVDLFTAKLLHILDSTVPKRRVQMHPTDKPWITGHIKQEIKARQRAYTRGDVNKYKQLCVKVSNLIVKAKENYYRTQVTKLRKRNQSKWYQAISDLTSTNSQQNSNLPTDDTTSVAEQLQRSFVKPWQEATPSAIPGINDVSHLLEDVPPPTPSIGQVKAELRHLNSKKSTGIDGIPAWVLKRFHEELALVVHNIICASIMQCKYPVSYKHALVCPVPKVYPPNDINNDFRQISILPQLAKVLEKLQLKLNRSKITISANQHAFTAGRSTVSALTYTSQKWFNVTENSNTGQMGVHVLFVDFRKAFDLVDHGILLQKLAEHRVNRSFWLWVKSFLEHRSQQVKVGDTLSSIMPCPLGVPQGSVLSPTLFNIHIDDLQDSVPVQLDVDTCMYADDCTQDETIKIGHTSNMQVVLNAAKNWADKNKMVLNAKKTKDMWICFKECIPEPDILKIEDMDIERVKSFKLLGVWHQNDLKWNKHINEISNKACKRLFCLRECRRANLPTEIGILCYETKIRPLLEYAAPIWGGFPKYLSDEIENIQERSMRILGLPKDTLVSLKERRDKLTVAEFKRIKEDASNPNNKFIPIPLDNNFNLRSFVQYKANHLSY